MNTQETDFGRGVARWHVVGEKQKPALHFLSANGHASSTYAFFFKRFLAHYRIVTMENRAVWPNKPPMRGVPFKPWRNNILDYLAFLDNAQKYISEGEAKGEEGHQKAPVIHFGHSMGGTLGVLTALQNPARFSRLILIDPATIPNYPGYLLYRTMPRFMLKKIGFIKATAKRRSYWPNKQTFIADMKTKRTYSGFSDEAFHDYADGGLVEKEGAWHLRYPGTAEAFHFTDAPYLPSLLSKLRVPTLWLHAEYSDVMTPEKIEPLNERYNKPNSFITFKKIPGVGHMAPQENPDLVARLVMEWLAEEVYSG